MLVISRFTASKSIRIHTGENVDFGGKLGVFALKMWISASVAPNKPIKITSGVGKRRAKFKIKNGGRFSIFQIFKTRTKEINH